MKSGRFPVLFLFILIFVTTMQAISARAGENELVPVPVEDVVWTLWDNEFYTLVDDGDQIWIGGGNGLMRLDKARGSYTRWSMGDGLPHHRVFAGALDNNDNRWFGGDGGLSKLAAGGEWTHYNMANSDLFNNTVRDIAVSSMGDIWTGHEGSSKISRLRPDGSWQLYPNPQTAVSLDYETVRQTINTTDLWTISGDEIWVGHDVYDGTKWVDRQPADVTGEAMVMRSDSENYVYALHEYAVARWDGMQWETYNYQPSEIDGELYSMAVDKDDDVWVGGYEIFGYYTWYTEASVSRLADEPGPFNLDQPITSASPVTLLLGTSEGLWAAGSNWLSQPDGQILRFKDVPYRSRIREVQPNNGSGIWIVSNDDGGTAVQAFDDQGTATKRDDRGLVVFRPYSITAINPAGNGDLWVATANFGRFFTPFFPDRIHNGELITYATPVDNMLIREIFAEDETHTWFAYAETDLYGATDSTGLWSLDDGGTPSNLSDDVWTTIDTGELGPGMPAARDGKLWYGTNNGVYLYQEDGWLKISSAEVKTLIPAKDGVLFVDDDWSSVLVIYPDGSTDHKTVDELLENDFSLVRSATSPNELWTVSPDGVVWYWYDDYGYYREKKLASFDGHTLRTYDSPFNEGRLTVDENNHLWLTGEGIMWRLSAVPGFELSTGPHIWFLGANESREFAVNVSAVEGFAEEVEVAINGLPAGVTAEPSQISLKPGETGVFRLTATNATIGKNTLTIRGSSGDLLQELEIPLAVVEAAHEMWLPAFISQ